MTESSFMQEGKLDTIVVGFDNVALNRDDDVFKILPKPKPKEKIEMTAKQNLNIKFEQGIKDFDGILSLIS